MKLVIGTAQFGLDYGVTNNNGKLTDESISKIFSVMNAHGIDKIDTACGYGDAHARLKRYLLNGKYKVSTKVSVGDLDFNNLKNSVKNRISSIIDELGVSALDTILIHDPSQLDQYSWLKLEEVFREICDIQLVGSFGMSVYSPSETRCLLNAPCFVQLPLSIFNQTFINSGEIDRLKDLGCTIQVRSIFHQGLALSRNWGEKFMPYKRINSTYWGLIDSESVDPIKLCFDYIRSINSADEVVVGVTSPQELLEIARVVNDDSNIIEDFPYGKLAGDETFSNPALWGRL